jgi:hypothetical protein
MVVLAGAAAMMMCAQTMGGDRFVLERQGTRFELVLPAPAGHSAVIAAEELRLRSGAPPVTYVLATLDNRSGTGTAVLPSLEVRTAGRDRAVPLEAAGAVLDRWLGQAPAGEIRIVAERLLDRLPARGGNELAVRQGERAETLLIAEGRLGKPARVTALAQTGKLVTPGGPIDFRRVPDHP